MSSEAGLPDDDLEQLVALTIKSVSPNKCWATLLPEGAVLFIKRVGEIERDTPGRVNKAEVRRILQAKWGNSPSKEAVSRHFRGECQCAKA